MTARVGGLTIPTEGVGGSWIVKLPSQQFAGVPENEFSMTTLARMIGMDVPPIDLGTCTVDPPLQRACRVS
jgi:serine/threonine-protein kinase HipA